MRHEFPEAARARLLLGAGALLVFLIVPIALAGSAGSSGDPEAIAGAGVKTKVKKLNRQLKAVKQRLAALEGEQGDPRPPSGDAGGDLTGNYPNPQVGLDVLTGENIDESTLGQVPSAVDALNAGNASSAANAGNATNLNGLQARAFHYAQNLNTGNESFLSLGGLVIFALCEADGDIQITAGTGTNGSYIRATNAQVDATFNTNESIDVDNGLSNGVVTITYRQGPAAAASTTFNSESVTATVGFDESAGSPNCIASGTALGRP